MVANGKAAMELQGDWDPATMQGLTSGTAFKSQIGWFPFPAVTGAPGDPSVALGGGDGFSCTIRAASACAGFLQYIDSASEQQKFAAQGIGLPVNPSAAASLSDPTLQTALQYTQKSSYIQTYFDIAFPTNVGQALDDAVANYFAGQGTPQSIVQQIQQTATGGGK
jgi:raffinose/stachyose/melibiose transport system substrate-binding protein